MSTRTNILSSGNFVASRAARPVGSVAMIMKFLGIWRERQTLRSLDARLLQDIGYSRSEANTEADRPAWDAPNRWLR